MSVYFIEIYKLYIFTFQVLTQTIRTWYTIYAINIFLHHCKIKTQLQQPYYYEHSHASLYLLFTASSLTLHKYKPPFIFYERRFVFVSMLFLSDPIVSTSGKRRKNIKFLSISKSKTYKRIKSKNLEIKRF